MRFLLRLFIVLLFFFLTPAILAAEGREDVLPIAPEHSIVLKSGSQQPEWMQLWEQARSLSRSFDNASAANLYQQILAQKPYIEEALREYVLVLMALQRWGTAGDALQELLEMNPDSLEYQLYAGRIALIRNHYNRAATYLGQVYTQSPNGPYALEALRGQILALQKMGLREMAYPLMELLYLLVPHEREPISRLARYSLELGYKYKAIMYYKTLIHEFGATALEYQESAVLFSENDDMDMAVRCWQGYLRYEPDYLPFHQKLSDFFLQSEERESALPHLLAQIVQGEERAGIFLEVGKLYLNEKGRPDKALYYYDEYQKRRPDDDRVDSEIEHIQAILANDLLIIVENEGAWNLWRDLAKVVPDRLAVYYSMAKQLEKLEKSTELREVLEIIHFHNPGDQKVLFRLARLHCDEEAFEACSQALDSLEEAVQRGREYFLLRAHLAEKTGELVRALSYYKSYLLEDSGDYERILHAMTLAGKLGYMDELKFFYGRIPGKTENSPLYFKASLLYADTLVRNGLYSMARDLYTQLLDPSIVEYPQRLGVREKIVKTLQYEGNYFVAEQKYRQLLLESGGQRKYLQNLVDNAVHLRDWDSAWKWHEFQVKESRQSENPDSAMLQELFLQKLSILSAAGQYAVAIELAEDYLEEHPVSSLVMSKLVQLYYLDKDYDAARELLASKNIDSWQFSVLSVLVDEKIGTETQKQKESMPVTGLYDQALQYEQYGAYDNGLESVRSYLQSYPASLHGRVLYARLLQSSGDDFATLAFYRELSAEYPDEQYFKDKVLQLQFKSAKFNNIITELAPERSIRNKNEATLSKKEQLLLARTFWATKKYDKALSMYSLLLQPPVEWVFSEKLDSKNIILQLPPVKRNFWHHVTFTTPPEPDRLRVVMSPEYARQNMDTAAVKSATELYAEYRWQQLAAEELSIRQDMVDGNYYQAMKDYQKMLGRNPSMESLFDLAGIYSRLGFLGREAALYKVIQSKSPGYPDLDEAMERNRLKRRPRLTTLYDYEKKEGREGYFDNRQQAAGGQGWFMPSLKHQVLVDYRRISNESIDRQYDLLRNRLQMEVKWSPSYDLNFSAGIGDDRHDDAANGTLLYDFRVNGRLDDMAEAFLSVSQDVVDDTMESLYAGISSREVAGGLRLDLLPRLFSGGNYFYTEYSDANHQNKYELWTSYILHQEPTLLQLRYDYGISHNANGNSGRVPSLRGELYGTDHPYWSPIEYWQHLFSVSFEHQIAEDVLGRGAPSSYRLEYLFGYEDGGYDNHQLKADIFLEISRHFLLNSSFDYTNGAKYEKQDFFVSLIYRW